MNLKLKSKGKQHYNHKIIKIAIWFLIFGIRNTTLQYFRSFNYKIHRISRLRISYAEFNRSLSLSLHLLSNIYVIISPDHLLYNRLMSFKTFIFKCDQLFVPFSIPFEFEAVIARWRWNFSISMSCTCTSWNSTNWPATA